jgi:two-component system chemotaxis response regulator CheY
MQQSVHALWPTDVTANCQLRQNLPPLTNDSKALCKVFCGFGVSLSFDETSLGTIFGTHAAQSRCCSGVVSMPVDTSIPVLVVDDYKTMVRIIRNLLKQLGFSDIDDAKDGQEALEKMKVRKYGLVISDWNMEPMTGYELLKSVRSNESLQRTPFIMVTAESKTENVVAAKKAGVNNYIVKPFNAATLKSKIDAVFGD